MVDLRWARCRQNIGEVREVIDYNLPTTLATKKFVSFEKKWDLFFTPRADRAARRIDPSPHLPMWDELRLRGVPPP